MTAPFEGHGASIAFGTSSFTASWTSLSTGPVTRAVISTTHLGTSNAKTSQPADLYDPGQLRGQCHYDPDSQPPFSGASETVTLTYPPGSGQTNGATEASSAYVIEFSPGELTTDGNIIADVVLQRTGAITFVDGS